MSSEIHSAPNNFSRLEAQIRNSRYDLEQQQERDIQDRVEKHADRIQKLEAEHRKTLDDLREDFDVQVSAEAAALEERLQQIRNQNEEMLTQEKNWGDEELKKVKEHHHQSIEKAKEEADLRLLNQRQELKKAEFMQQQQLKESVRNYRKG